MESLDALFPINVPERPLRFAGASTEPATLIVEGLREAAREWREAEDALLVTLAHAWSHVRRLGAELSTQGAETANAAEAAEIIAANLFEALAARDVRVEDHSGEEWTPALRDVVDVRGSSPRDDVTVPIVRHMELPVVYRRDRLLARGACILETPRR
jgi:hypothetical protein